MNYRNDGDPITPVENSRVPAMVDNWVRLGLVQVSYERALAGPEHYTWVEARPEVIAIRLRYAPETRRVEIRKGVLTCTNLGMQFGAAVGLIGPMVPTRKE